jgi:glycosyltransferase involved in cell wall biosynthesis
VTPGCGVSVVVPVYNSEATLRELVARLTRVLAEQTEPFEIILVNDGSCDGSWQQLERLAEENTRVVAVDLTRNFGQINSSMCGIARARYNTIVTMDDDLQHPPEEVPTLLAAMATGRYDVVFGAYPSTGSGWRAAGSRLVNGVYHKAHPHARGVELTSFRALSSAVAAGISQFRTTAPMLNGMILSTAGRIGSVPVRHEPRKTGQTGYRFSSLARLATQVLFYYSEIPLRAVALCGLTLATLTLLAGIGWLIYAAGHNPAHVPWAIACILMSLLGASILAMLAVIGGYLRRILAEVSGRPPYVVRCVRGGGSVS